MFFQQNPNCKRMKSCSHRRYILLPHMGWDYIRRYLKVQINSNSFYWWLVKALLLSASWPIGQRRRFYDWLLHVRGFNPHTGRVMRSRILRFTTFVQHASSGYSWIDLTLLSYALVFWFTNGRLATMHLLKFTPCLHLIVTTSEQLVYSMISPKESTIYCTNFC